VKLVAEKISKNVLELRHGSILLNSEQNVQEATQGVIILPQSQGSTEAGDKNKIDE
jgi:hypothetical protein